MKFLKLEIKMRLLVLLTACGFLLAGEGVATYKVDGMMCAMNCPAKVVDSIKDMNGVKNCEVDFQNKTATVTFDDEKINSDKIAKKMADATYYKVTAMNKEKEKAGSWFSRLFQKS